MPIMPTPAANKHAASWHVRICESLVFASGVPEAELLPVVEPPLEPPPEVPPEVPFEPPLEVSPEVV